MSLQVTVAKITNLKKIGIEQYCELGLSVIILYKKSQVNKRCLLHNLKDLIN